MKTLVKSLKSTLMLGLEDRDLEAFRLPVPHVYVKAIACEADLITSLSGVAELTRTLGFTEAPETLYGDGGRSATYHVTMARFRYRSRWSAIPWPKPWPWRFQVWMQTPPTTSSTQRFRPCSVIADPLAP